ncbi:ubiquitin-like domain-containing protein [Petroclostridium sp. X23]|uniref:ubiquitin-like domain-containing protein n=1 Tax=Petroclostridium sp. X23 TaxID=3045146 RepID=UPI0024AD4EBE|nr:ubiquitin-like domain-containing protein [Petroclostridium sp. X23]WHH57056.1 ubiquitin-like domain-containing protein [Petroclostridium sp. X23]
MTELEKWNKISWLKFNLGGRKMHLNGKVKEFARSVRMFFLTLFIVASLIASAFNAVIASTKEVCITDGQEVTYVKSLKSSVKELLEEKNIKLYEGDEIYPSLEEKLQKNQQIVIKRAVPVTILVDGNEINIKTVEETVKDVLAQAQVQVNEKDKINFSITDQITAGMKINVVRVAEKIETITEKIPFNVITRANERMDKGKSRTVQQGKEGVQQKQYQVVLHDGQEVSRDLVSDTTVSEPVDEINEYGTVAVHKTSRGETFRYKKIVNMRATAYDLSYESCGKNPGDKYYGITYTGMKARYGVVAVDPKVIPLYSRLYIEAADGSWVYGHAVAGDIGGGVKGNIIDLFYDDHDFVKNFGIKKVKVYMLEK